MEDSRDIDKLHVALQRGYRELKKRLEAVGYLYLGVSSTYRSSDYQDYLYAKGRTAPGSIVTNAKGGQSMHNYRLAFDIFKNIKGSEYNDAKFFATAGSIWHDMGGVWGGHWSNFPDNVHFEFSNGLTIKDLQNGKKLKDDAKMPWETSTTNTPKEEEKIMRYNKVTEMPIWAKATIEKLIEKKMLVGNSGDNQQLDLSLDMIRIFVIHDRLGLYDGNGA